MDLGAPLDDWEGVDDEGYEPPVAPVWRRRALIGVAALVAASMLGVPVWNLIDRPEVPRTAAGLEICGFDYCDVQEAVIAAGLNRTMGRLSATLLTVDEARAFADDLVEFLGEEAVAVDMVERLSGRASGRYDSTDRRILLERPLRAWVVLHEVAHVRESGHGPGFQRAVIDLALWADSAGLP